MTCCVVSRRVVEEGRGGVLFSDVFSFFSILFFDSACIGQYCKWSGDDDDVHVYVQLMCR